MTRMFEIWIEVVMYFFYHLICIQFRLARGRPMNPITSVAYKQTSIFGIFAA